MTIEVLIAIVVVGLLFDYTNGFHDAANVVSTVIATRVLTPLTAITLASLLNFLGATRVSNVAQTIATGLIEPGGASQLVVLSALLGAVAWNLLTWKLGIPSSSSYALVGGLVGTAFIYQGSQVILWKGLIFKVIIPMILSPIGGFALAFIGMKGLQRWVGLKGAGKRGVFAHLQVASASLVALSHGFNDAQKSMGVITLGLFSAGMISSTKVPVWVIAICALMMGLGTASGGMRIIRTVGFEITKIAPIQGFAAETSASFVILLAGFLGMPVSSTHMIVGAVTGVGAAKGIDQVRWMTFRKLLFAWVFTLPGSAMISSGIFLFLVNL